MKHFVKECTCEQCRYVKNKRKNRKYKKKVKRMLNKKRRKAKLGMKDVPISKEQIDTIKIIIRHWYNGIIWPGFDPSNRCSVLRWAQSDPLQFKLKWFAF